MKLGKLANINEKTAAFIKERLDKAESEDRSLTTLNGLTLLSEDHLSATVLYLTDKRFKINIFDINNKGKIIDKRMNIIIFEGDIINLKQWIKENTYKETRLKVEIEIIVRHPEHLPFDADIDDLIENEMRFEAIHEEDCITTRDISIINAEEM